MKKKLIFKTILILLLIVLIACLSIFIYKQASPVKDNKVTSSGSTRHHRKKDNVKNNTTNSKGEVKGSNSNSVKEGRPNAGKTLYFNTVNEAEDAINQHRANCPYKGEPFYPGLVYTGTYRCKCGLKIIWWDQKLKDGFDNGHSDDPRVQSMLGQDNSSSSENSEQDNEETITEENQHTANAGWDN